MPQREKAFIRCEEGRTEMLFLVFIRTLFSAIKHIHTKHTEQHKYRGLYY